MIKILNSFQHTSNLDLLAQNDWQIIDNKIDTSFIKKAYPIYDESSLEIGLRILDQSKELSFDLKLDALSIDNELNPFAIKNLFAMGFNDIYNLKSTSLNDSLNNYVNVFKEYLNNYNYDLIIMGQSSNIYEAMQFPYYIASHLNYHCYTNVREVTLIDEKSIKIKYVIDQYEIDEVISLPAVVCIGNASNTYLRIPTLKNKLAVKDKQITTLDYILNDNKVDVELVELKNNIFSKECLFYSDDKSLQEQVLMLYNDYLKEEL